MCHKHRSIGRIDENGKKHRYHVNEVMFSQSVHRNVSCSDCHTGISKIPHEPVTENVNCASKCHIKPPFSQEKFSHQKIIGLYKGSAHAIKSSDTRLRQDARPNCKFCHLNPLYRKISAERINYDKTLARCNNCHPQKGVIMAYKHITHRLRTRTSRSSGEIVALCAKCHGDKTLMGKLGASKIGMNAVESYNRSVHGKLVSLGSEKAANCLNCHASSTLHDIYGSDHKNSTINRDNIMKACSQCHENANELFVDIAVHPDTAHAGNPVIKLISLSLSAGMYGSVLALVGLLLLETRGRRRDGARLIFRKGTIWHGKSGAGPKKKS